MILQYLYLSVVFHNKYQSCKYENTAGQSANVPPPELDGAAWYDDTIDLPQN